VAPPPVPFRHATPLPSHQVCTLDVSVLLLLLLLLVVVLVAVLLRA
jgi:hypothetical protein